MYLLLPGLGLLLTVGALIDIIRAESWAIRHLDKSIWIIIVILLPLIGSVLWFAIGRDYRQSIDLGRFGDPRRWEASTSGRGMWGRAPQSANWQRSNARSSDMSRMTGFGDLKRNFSPAHVRSPRRIRRIDWARW